MTCLRIVFVSRIVAGLPSIQDRMQPGAPAKTLREILGQFAAPIATPVAASALGIIAAMITISAGFRFDA